MFSAVQLGASFIIRARSPPRWPIQVNWLGIAMRVKVLYFGRLKELSGSSEESIELRDGARIEDLFAHCCSARPELRKFRSSLVAARNREFAPWETPLRAGDEIGFLPPVSGG